MSSPESIVGRYCFFCSSVPCLTKIGPQWPVPIGLMGRCTFARLSSSSMISCVIGSASRPQGFGQCGTTYPPSARSLPVGWGCAESHSRTSTRLGSSSPGSSKSLERTSRATIGRHPEKLQHVLVGLYRWGMEQGRDGSRGLTERQAERRDRVVKAAIDLASSGGYEAVQMRDVASKAGVAL